MAELDGRFVQSPGEHWRIHSCFLATVMWLRGGDGGSWCPAAVLHAAEGAEEELRMVLGFTGTSETLARVEEEKCEGKKSWS